MKITEEIMRKYSPKECADMMIAEKLAEFKLPITDGGETIIITKKNGG